MQRDPSPLLYRLNPFLAVVFACQSMHFRGRRESHGSRSANKKASTRENRDDDGDVDDHVHNGQRESQRIERSAAHFRCRFSEQAEVAYLFARSLVRSLARSLARSLSRKLGQPVNRKKKRVHVRLLGWVDPFEVAVNACTLALAPLTLP